MKIFAKNGKNLHLELEKYPELNISANIWSILCENIWIFSNVAY